MGEANFLSGCQRGGASRFSNTCDRDRFNSSGPADAPAHHRRAAFIFTFLLAVFCLRHAGDDGDVLGILPVTACKIWVVLIFNCSRSSFGLRVLLLKWKENNAVRFLNSF